jgi:peroxiredoxin
MKKTFIVIAVIAIAGLAVFYQMKNRTPFDEQKPAVGDAAPAISLADLNGKMVTLNDLKGKVVLVNFWASWCPPCTNEMPGFEKVFGEYESKGFAVIGVALDDIKLSLIQDMRITYTVVKTNERVTRDYGSVSGVPISILVGRDGRIIRKVKEFYPEASLRSDVERALQVPR